MQVDALVTLLENPAEIQCMGQNSLQQVQGKVRVRVMDYVLFDCLERRFELQLIASRWPNSLQKGNGMNNE